MKPNGIVTLLTDFGLADPYTGALKGALLAVHPSARIIDVTHQAPAMSPRAGAFIGGAAWPFYPAGCVHIAVVDPGVGTERLPLLLETPDGWLIGPDNGLLSPALPAGVRPQGEAAAVSLPRGYRAFALQDTRFQRQPVSATFHGRDIFAPAAGHLLNGVSPEQFGPRLDRILALPEERAARGPGGSLQGVVLYVDHFGNLVTNIRAEDLPPHPRIQAGGRVVKEGLAGTYGGIGRVAALVGSSGYLELACREGDAARELAAGPGTPVTVSPG